MWNQPTAKQLAKIPALYSTEEVALKGKKIYMHFFIGGSDWYIAEYDEKNGLFFGYAILNNDLEMGEWGYFSFQELKDIKVGGWLEVDRDKYWEVCNASEVEKIINV
ncbi:MAG: DUF2958 domain-containing protein [Nitrospirae bacterium]|nr:DUF2958 domain-containing protein [Nitrospirota bacterium]